MAKIDSMSSATRHKQTCYGVAHFCASLVGLFAAVSCPGYLRKSYDSCRHNSREIREYVLRITSDPNDETPDIAEFLDQIGDYHSPYRGYPRLMECFENMAGPDQGESSQMKQLARYASAFMGEYTRLPTRTRAALWVALYLQKREILSAFEGIDFE